MFFLGSSPIAGIGEGPASRTGSSGGRVGGQQPAERDEDEHQREEREETVVGDERGELAGTVLRIAED